MAKTKTIGFVYNVYQTPNGLLYVKINQIQPVGFVLLQRNKLSKIDLGPTYNYAP